MVGWGRVRGRVWEFSAFSAQFFFCTPKTVPQKAINFKKCGHITVNDLLNKPHMLGTSRKQLYSFTPLLLSESLFPLLTDVVGWSCSFSGPSQILKNLVLELSQSPVHWVIQVWVSGLTQSLSLPPGAPVSGWEMGEGKGMGGFLTILLLFPSPLPSPLTSLLLTSLEMEEGKQDIIWFWWPLGW